MKPRNFSYRIFDTVLNSSIALPELPAVSEENSPNVKNLVFRLTDSPLISQQSPEWLYHWYFPDGRVSLACGKILDTYYLRFPQLADFAIAPLEKTILCSPVGGVDKFTLRHLLLDQVIPRLLGHNGQLILHASAVRLNEEILLFLGKTGQGKSTLAMALHQHGCHHVTDDCVSLDFSENYVNCIGNYIGARLWPDSLTALSPQYLSVEKKTETGKTRLYFPFDHNDEPLSLPVKAIFFLEILQEDHSESYCSIVPVAGADKFMEMNKHCFPLDLTDQTSARSRFQNMSRLANSDTIFFARLSYRKDYAVLPEICKTVLSACTEHLTPGCRQK